MTREQAINNFIDEDACCQGRVDVPRLINRIYNDFESRVCENCKYNMYRYSNAMIECNLDIHQHIGSEYNDFDFGCNYFERKKEKQRNEEIDRHNKEYYERHKDLIDSYGGL